LIALPGLKPHIKNKASNRRLKPTARLKTKPTLKQILPLKPTVRLKNKEPLKQILPLKPMATTMELPH
jgi:hypothetical protein